MIHVNGIDVSDWQGDVDWSQVRADGYTFAYAKATQGNSYVAQTFEKNWAGMKQAGILRGAYHMFDFTVSPQAQAQYFLDVYQPAPGDLPPMIDLELPTVSSPRESVAAIASFLGLVEKKAPRHMLVYISYGFWEGSLGSTDGFSGHPLWLANYTNADQPTALPHVWNAMTMWQYSQNGNVGGISGTVDLDRFVGTPSDLRALLLP